MNLFNQLQQQAQALAAQAEQAAKKAEGQFRAFYDEAKPHVDEFSQQVGDYTGQASQFVGEKADEAATFVKQYVEESGIDPAKSITLDEIGRKIASFGMPAIIFTIAAGSAVGMGLAGGAVVTTALALIGGPVGMIGGLVTLGITTVPVANVITNSGVAG